MDIDAKRQKDGSYIATVKRDKRKPRLRGRGQTWQQAVADLWEQLAQGASERDNRSDV